MSIELETTQLLLRRWRDEDLNAYARIYADPEVMRYLPGVQTREQSADAVAKFVCHWEERNFGLWAVEEKMTGTFIGFIGLLHQEDWPEGEYKAEVGWRLDRSFWGRGLATEGARECLRYGFEEVSLNGIISMTVPENLASRRVMEKCGLVYRGMTNCRGYEVAWYAMDRSEWETHRRPAEMRRSWPNSAPRQAPDGCSQ